jgi:hypothetical protein
VSYRTILLGLSAASVFVAAPAVAATAKFECDTGSSRYSIVSLPVAGQHVRVSGAVSSELARQDGDWIPKLSLFVGDPQKQAAGFTVAKQPGQQWEVALAYSPEGSAVVATMARLGPTPFILDVNASAGTLDLTLGQNHHHASGHPFSPQQLTLACSTGEFLFDQLTWDVLPN